MHRMHVVIGGYGRVGRILARMLEYEGHSVAVIDHDPYSFEEAETEIAGQQFEGQVFDKQTLEDAGIERADCYAAVTSGDNSNIVSARIAKLYYKVPNVIARIYDPRRAEIYRNLGVATVASVTWSSARLLDMIAHPELHSAFQFGNGEVEMMEVRAPVSFHGRRIAEFEVAGEITVAAIVRGHAAMVVTPGTTFENDDRLYVMVARESVGKLERLLGLQ